MSSHNSSQGPLLVLVIGIGLTLIGAAISLIRDWKAKGAPDRRKVNTLAILTACLVLFGAILTGATGKSSIDDKLTSDSLAAAKEHENKIANDSIQSLNRQLLHLAEAQLDTSKTILEVSNKLQAANQRIIDLQGELHSYLVGDDITPWITTIPVLDRVTFTMLNPGRNPMWNVKEKCQEQQLNDVGVLPIRVMYRFYTASMPKGSDMQLFDFVVWYNNGKSVLVNVYISRRPDGSLNQDSVVYMDRNGVRFEHPLTKHKPKGYWNYKTPGYKPDQTY